MTDDQSLGDTSPARTEGGGMTPFGDPTGTANTPTISTARQWTMAEILDSAKPPEEHAKVSLRGDLQADFDQIITELAGLIDAQGRLIEDEERSAGEQSNAARAAELSDRLVVVRKKMRDFMWFPLFRGLTSDELRDFNKEHRPKSDGADLTEYNTLLIAECSVATAAAPKLSPDDVRALRAKLGSNAVGELARTANKVCTQGGVDFPQLPAGLQRLKQP